MRSLPQRGIQVDPVDRLQGLFPQVVVLHGDEPLLGGPEDDRLLAAPAVGIGVADLLRLEQGPCLAQQLDDAGVGLTDPLAGKLRHLLGEAAVVVHRRIGRQAVFQAALVVFLAVAGGGVDQPVPASRVT